MQRRPMHWPVCCHTLRRITQRAHFPVTPPLAQRNSLSAPLLLVLLPSCSSTHLRMLFVCKHAGTCPYFAHMLHFTVCMPLFTGLLLLQPEPLPNPLHLQGQKPSGWASHQHAKCDSDLLHLDLRILFLCKPKTKLVWLKPQKLLFIYRVITHLSITGFKIAYLS